MVKWLLRYFRFNSCVRHARFRWAPWLVNYELSNMRKYGMGGMKIIHDEPEIPLCRECKRTMHPAFAKLGGVAI